MNIMLYNKVYKHVSRMDKDEWDFYSKQYAGYCEQYREDEMLGEVWPMTNLLDVEMFHPFLVSEDYFENLPKEPALPGWQYNLPFEFTWIEFFGDGVKIYDKYCKFLLVISSDEGGITIVSACTKNRAEFFIYATTPGDETGVEMLNEGMLYANRKQEDERLKDPGMIKIHQIIERFGNILKSKNVELEKNEYVRSKKERKSLKDHQIPKPYYTLKVDGVSIKSCPKKSDSGVKHGFKYDVRGHFRNLRSGDQVWVRPHQRGQGVYIPKTYQVK